MTHEHNLVFLIEEPGIYCMGCDFEMSDTEVFNMVAENARLLVERDEWKEKAQAKDGTIQYWRGEVAHLSSALENIKAYLLRAGLKEINTGNKVELAIYLSLHEAKQALGEQS